MRASLISPWIWADVLESPLCSCIAVNILSSSLIFSRTKASNRRLGWISSFSLFEKAAFARRSSISTVFRTWLSSPSWSRSRWLIALRLARRLRRTRSFLKIINSETNTFLYKKLCQIYLHFSPPDQNYWTFVSLLFLGDKSVHSSQLTFTNS